MPRGNWVEIIMLVLFVGSSAIAAIYKKLKEQAAKKRAQDETIRREMERLRTGRDPVVRPAPIPTVEDRRAAEIAQRRRAQIEELRRRAAARAGGPGGVVIQTPGGPPIVIAPAPRQGPTAPRPVPQAQPPSRRDRKRKATPTPARTVIARPLSSLVVGESDTQRRVTEADEPPPPPTSRVAELLPRTPDDWRRAFILREVLERPLALREEPIQPIDS